MSEKRPYKVLGSTKRAEVREIWALGDATLTELAERYEVSESTVVRIVSGIEKGSKAGVIAEKVEAAVAEAAGEAAEKRAKRILEVKDDAARRSETLSKMIMREIARAVQGNVPLASIAPDLKALKLAAEALKICRGETYEILGIDPNEVDERELPELVFRVVSDEEIREEVERQTAAFDAEYAAGGFETNNMVVEEK